MTTFPDLLKHWRKLRRLSQLDLALEADVSARHISFLETGRARPSRDMITRLGDVLNLPLDARNGLMVATGFAPRYPKTPLNNEDMAPIAKAIERMLDRHAPYPGLAMDRHWDIVMLNAPAKALFAPLGLAVGGSLLDLLLDDNLPLLIENWPEVAYHSAQRLRAESLSAGGIEKLDAAVEILAKQGVEPESFNTPIIPTIYRFGDQRLSLFGTIAQFSTVNDQTLDDLKVELFYPSDAETEAFFDRLAIV